MHAYVFVRIYTEVYICVCTYILCLNLNMHLYLILGLCLYLFLYLYLFPTLTRSPWQALLAAAPQQATPLQWHPSLQVLLPAPARCKMPWEAAACEEKRLNSKLVACALTPSLACSLPSSRPPFLSCLPYGDLSIAHSWVHVAGVPHAWVGGCWSTSARNCRSFLAH